MGHDYREEVVAVTPVAINIYYNPDPLEVGQYHPTPRADPEYRKWRMEHFNAPYTYQGAGLTAVGDHDVPDPAHGSLRAHPNPFNPRTTLSFDLSARARVELTIVDLAGRTVATLETGILPAGAHEIVWSGEDDRCRPLPSSTYFARLVAGKVTEQCKLVLVR